MDEVYVSLSFQIVSLLYILAAVFIYIKQKKILTVENKIFTVLLVITNIVLYMDILVNILIYTLFKSDNYLSLTLAMDKIYILVVIFWLLFFTYYIIISNSKHNVGLVPIVDNPHKKYYKKVKINFVISYFALIFVLSFIPNKIITGNQIYFHGWFYWLSNVIVLIFVISWILLLVYNRKQFRIKNHLYLIISITLTLFCLLLCFLYPSIRCLGSVIVFDTLSLYFCIENPDIKLVEELNIVTKAAEKANNEKSQFLVEMYHEIKNPLNAIYGFSSALKEEKLNRKSLSEVEEIYSSSNHLLNIINKLLEIADIEVGKAKINNQEYDSKKLFDSIAMLCKVRLSNKNIKFVYQLDKDLPPVLYGDSVKIKQILMNLITNATRYTDEGFISFIIKSSIEGDNCHITILVDDSGRGMSYVEQDDAFNSYNHIHIASISNSIGSGLGLALTKKLLEIMGGTILLVSDKNLGSRFTVVLTQKISNKLVEEIAEPVPKIPKIFDASNTKVLVVDDNKMNLKVAKYMLKEYKIEPELCESGFDCLNLIKSGKKYDIIFLDEVMPKMSGTGTLSELIKVMGFNSVVIALTANSDPEAIEQFKTIGYTDFLLKPIDKYELYTILKKYARSKEYPRESIYYKI